MTDKPTSTLRPCPASVQTVSNAMMALRSSAAATAALATAAIDAINAAVPDMGQFGMLVVEPGPMKLALWDVVAIYDKVLTAHDLGSKIMIAHTVDLPVVLTRGGGGR